MLLDFDLCVSQQLVGTGVRADGLTTGNLDIVA